MAHEVNLKHLKDPRFFKLMDTFRDVITKYKKLPFSDLENSAVELARGSSYAVYDELRRGEITLRTLKELETLLEGGTQITKEYLCTMKEQAKDEMTLNAIKELEQRIKSGDAIDQDTLSQLRNRISKETTIDLNKLRNAMKIRGLVDEALQEKILRFIIQNEIGIAIGIARLLSGYIHDLVEARNFGMRTDTMKITRTSLNEVVLTIDYHFTELVDVGDSYQTVDIMTSRVDIIISKEKVKIGDIVFKDLSKQGSAHPLFNQQFNSNQKSLAERVIIFLLKLVGYKFSESESNAFNIEQELEDGHATSWTYTPPEQPPREQKASPPPPPPEAKEAGEAGEEVCAETVSCQI